ncbi:hypothetical protein [Sphingobacterium psychroaquaticum]|nr:hypothetical protein [Sphingobacterium psychroaquaticum]
MNYPTNVLKAQNKVGQKASFSFKDFAELGKTGTPMVLPVYSLQRFSLKQ